MESSLRYRHTSKSDKRINNLKEVYLHECWLRAMDTFCGAVTVSKLFCWLSTNGSALVCMCVHARACACVVCV